MLDETISIRSISEYDAKAFLTLLRKLDDQTSFMLIAPGERKTNEIEMKHTLNAISSAENKTIFIAETDESPIGYIGVYGGDYERNRRTAYIVIGILSNFRGMGIGTRLFKEVEDWADKKRLHRLELTVMSHNHHAVRLYQKAGFMIEGIRKDALLLNGRYSDEYYMAKILL